jgi:hypothetical protein
MHRRCGPDGCDGGSRGCGALCALQQVVMGSMVSGHPACVKGRRSQWLTDGAWAHTDQGPSLPVPTNPPFTSFVAGLSYDATETDVRRFFDGCKVKSVRLPTDRETGRPKGHGFVEFDDADSLRRGAFPRPSTLPTKRRGIKREDDACWRGVYVAAAGGG